MYASKVLDVGQMRSRRGISTKTMMKADTLEKKKEETKC